MSQKLPDALKADLPQNTWGKTLAATPVVMTVIATLLAGLASSEMTRAQYDRAMAAQLQSKAGDQWNYFQAKKLRAAMQRSTLDLLTATESVRRIPAVVSTLAADDPARSALEQGSVPSLPPMADHPAPIKAALEALEKQLPESDVLVHVVKVDDAVLEATLVAARARVTEFDALIRPITTAVDKIEATTAFAAANDAEAKGAARDVMAARLRYASARYEAEAKLNQAVGGLLEIAVRRANLSGERHHVRSQRFFYGMLGAQVAVIVATLAVAARQRNFLWIIAAIAGVAATAFAAYVYVTL